MTRATLLALLCLPAAWGAVVEDFEQPGGWVVHQGEQRGGSFEAVAAPAPRGLSGRLSWSVPHHHFLELQRRTALPLPALATALQGELVVQVASGQPEAINGVSLRLVDRDGEVLQFVSRVEKLGTGWQAVSFPLTPQNLRDSWGGTKNGRADPPLRLLGFAVSFTAAATTPGAIYLDDVALLTPGQEIETVRPLWRFDAGERWSVHEKLREVANLEPREGLVLTLSPVAKETGIPVYERGFATTSLAGATAITLRAELLEGSGTRFQLRLRDARGEVHPFATRSLAAGANTLRWSIPGDKATGNTWGQNLDGVLDPPLVLHELYVIQPAGAAPARIRLLEAALHGRKPRLEALSLEVETGNPIHVLKVGEESKLALSLRSEAAEPLTVQARVEYEDFAGAVTGSEQAVTVPAGGTAALRPPDLPAALGIYWINYTLSDAEGNSRRGRTSFCRMAPAGPTPERAKGFLFGICTHTERWPEAQQLKEIMAAGLCGAKVIRTGVGWGGIQPSEERWTWDHMDRLVERYGQQGMELQCLLAFTPQWAAPAEFRQAEYRVWSRKMPRLDAWRTWVTAMARRYGDRIRFWEVWNEPDIGFWLGSLDEYLQLLQTAHDAIKQVDPKLQVMTGGFAIYDRNPQFIEAVVDRGQAWFDIFAYHRHGDFDPFRREVDGPVAAMRARLRPPKPIYFNETAISSLPVGERGQAETLFKKLIYAWSRGSMGYTWYDLRNDGFDPKDWEHNYGMVTNDFYPKAVYPAFNTLVSLLRGHQYQHELALGADRYGFLFASEREQVVATWAEPAAGPARHLILSTDATRAEAVDLMGNRSPLALLAGGRVVLVNDGRPGFVVLHGARAKAALAGPLVALEGPYVALPGRPLALEAKVTNPLGAPAELKLNWFGPKGWRFEPAGATCRLAADGQAVTSTRLTAPADGRGGERTEVSLRYELPGTALAGAVTVPVETAVVLHDGEPARAPDFALSEQRDMVTLYGNDPNKAHLVWRGAADLSARVWLDRQPDALALRVQVTDDRHVQDGPAAEAWRGDSLQVALAVPGQAGHWEFALARGAAGVSLVATSIRPPGSGDPTAAIGLTTREAAGGVHYEVRLPLTALGLTAADLTEGLRFNLLVNDHDGEGREGWAQLAPGIGHTKDPRLFPLVLFENN